MVRRLKTKQSLDTKVKPQNQFLKPMPRPIVKTVQAFKQPQQQKTRIGLVTPLLPQQQQVMSPMFQYPIFADAIRKKGKKKKIKKDGRISREWFVGTVPIISNPKTMHLYWNSGKNKSIPFFPDRQLGRGYKVIK